MCAHLSRSGCLRTFANVCVPGILRSRRALEMVRKRVLAHLRQPHFDRKYVEDLPDAAAQQRALRDFYRMLGEAGFV